MENQKSNARLMSCSECQRRKQKCSRTWPCDHCRARKVSHLCQFGLKRAAPTEEDSPNDITLNDHDDSNAFAQQSVAKGGTSPEEAREGLRAWGYMPGHPNLRFACVRDQASEEFYGPEKSPESAIVMEVISTIPPRSLTDSLVQNFLYGHNYHYCSIHPPTFLDDYTAWWSKRIAGERLSLAFTCLILRVCACSVQFPTRELTLQLERELGENAQTLTERFNRAANKQSTSITPGRGGLAQVQQLFLMADWLKCEGVFVEAWHALASAIREAQELGMHKSQIRKDLTEFQLEMRKRVWCLLFVWDWHMSSWLSRPRIIHHTSHSAFQLSTVQLEDLDAPSGMPSPFTPIALQGKLGQALSLKFGEGGEDDEDLDYGQLDEMEFIVDNWLDELPAWYRVAGATTSWDDNHSYIPLQRLQLHATAYMTKLNYMRSHLMQASSMTFSNTELRLRRTAIECCLKLSEISSQLFDLVFPIDAKFHGVIFFLFDSATVLCSALWHDTHNTLPHRERARDAIATAATLLKKLGQLSKAGALSYAVLYKLVTALPSSDKQGVVQNHRSPKRLKPEPSSSSDATSENCAEFAFTPLNPESPNLAVSTAADDNWPLSFDWSADAPDLFDGVDVSDLGWPWDWDSINLDPAIFDDRPTKQLTV